MKYSFGLGLMAGTLALSTPALAQHEHHIGHHDHTNHARAPIGVMGDHMHSEGDWMLSYRYQHMSMNDNRIGTDDVSPETIVTTIANPNAPPPTLRVVPTDMTMDMHMVGAMYAPTDWLTLMAMGMYTEKEMDHITFAGAAGTARLGTFTTETSGFGDTSLTGLVRIAENDTHHLHANIGISLPTGSIDEEDDVLAPTGARPTLRVPYSMQLGTGTYDALPGVTYTGQKEGWSWGAQYKGRIALESENDEGYSWGDKHVGTAWAGYQFSPWFQGNLRVSGETMDEIDGADPLIAAPVQTADPDNYGGDILELNAGFNIDTDEWGLEGTLIGGEITVPVYQDLNGPRMKREWGLTVGISHSF